MSVRRAWSKTANTHLVLLLLATFSVFVYRDIWPLATYTLEPADAAEGSLFWGKFVTLLITAVAIPLLIPRPYVPIDPKVRPRNYMRMSSRISTDIHFRTGPRTGAQSRANHTALDINAL